MNRFRKRFITAVVAGALLGGGAYAAHRAYSPEVVPQQTQNIIDTEASAGNVWICGGPKSQRYHSSRNCGGLKRCSRTPQKISLSEAKKRYYTPCKKCYSK